MAMVYTCPEEEKHMDRVITEIGKIAISKIDSDETRLNGYIEDALVESNQESARLFIGNRLTVVNYALFSIGRITYEDWKETITIGAFNHVYCLKSANSLMEAIQEETSPANVIDKLINLFDKN